MQNIDPTFTKHDDSQEIELAVTVSFYLQCNELFTDNAINLFTLLRITRLDILFSEISVDILTDLIHHLPNLVSLRVCSLLSDKQASTLCLLPNTNKITNVNIQCLTELVQIEFLIDLCPCVQYLEIGCSNDINYKSLIRFILMKDMKYTPYLCFLCLSSQQVNDKMIQEVQQMIQLEKLQSNYVIKHTDNKVYLQWK